MDIVSFSQGKKAQKEMLKLQKDVGNTATTKHGLEDVKDTFENVDKRLEDIEFKLSPGETNKMISDATKKTMINLMKQQFKVDAIMQSRKESFENMVFDSFLDESSINKTKSSNYKYDSSLGRYSKNNASQKMVLEFNDQELKKPLEHIMYSVNISSLLEEIITAIQEKIVDQRDENGIYKNDTFSKETNVIELPNKMLLKKINISAIQPVGTTIEIYVKTSDDINTLANSSYLNITNSHNLFLLKFIQLKVVLNTIKKPKNLLNKELYIDGVLMKNKAITSKEQE